MSAVRILYLEDNPDDAELARHALARYGQDCTWQVVGNGPDFVAALEHGPFDLIISDHLVPGIDSLGALEAAQARQPAVPFVYLSGGHVLPRQAVANILTGAADQVSKDELWRLVPIVGRAREHRAHRELTHHALAQGQLCAARLETAQTTLEAFANCLAHDLRAMAQQSQMLGQARAHPEAAAHAALEKLQSVSQTALVRVEAARALVKVDRAEYQPVEVNLSVLARAVLCVLQTATSGRSVEVVVGEGLSAWGDPALLRTLLETLLGYACKTALASANPRVELGAVPRTAAEPALVVRTSADTLSSAEGHDYFAPFPCSPTDYTGPSPDLALAQHIVHRHGGQIWAEAATGPGVALFFTLPASDAERSIS